MLSKCLNSSCTTPFRYLHDGRIYLLEIPGTGGSGFRREYFWLCAACCARLRVVLKNGTGTVEHRFPELPSGDQIGQAEEE